MIESGDLSVELQKVFCGEIEVYQEGIDRYVINTPFMFEDGDHYVCVLMKQGGKWRLTDEGHTFMHMSYDMDDFYSGTRERVITESLGVHGIECRDGALEALVSEHMIGHAAFSFVQAIAKVSNVTKFTRDVVRSTFMEDFNGLIRELAEGHDYTFNWHDEENDVDGLYTVDCHVQGAKRPWNVFGVNSTSKCQHATICCLKLEQFDPGSRSIAVFEDQSALNSKSVARLTDSAWKQFSSLSDRNRIKKYFNEEVFASAGS